MKKLALSAAAAAFALCAPAAHAAQLVLVNVDSPGVGFNDTTAATPVGGNAGTTVGQQRLIAYQRALDLWGSVLKSNVPVRVRGSFAPLTCTAGGGTLAQAGAIAVFSDFANAPLPARWYSIALANALAGVDLDPSIDDIIANFNGRVGQPDCIAGPGFYYGLDNNPPAGAIDFLNTFMHEVAHGLGFQNFVNESTGAPLAGQADVYMANTRDLDLDLQWDQLSNSQIVASAVNNGKVVWTGPAVSFNSGFVLGNFEGVRLTGDLVREINFGTASFGATPSAATLNGDVVLVNDGAGASTSDGCEAIVNDVVGKVALIDRGSCTFAIKAQNAQNAGAKSVLIANNATGAFSPGGTSATVTLATIGISREDGDAIKAVLPSPGVGVGVEYFVDPSRLAGATEGFVRLFAPPTVVTGSTLSHYDTVATPNLLMEPSITSSLRASRNLDLTPSLMKDIGWQMETLKIQTCDSLVANALPNGELMSVAVDACGANLSGDKTAAKQCINNYARAKETAGLISRNNLVTISRCAAKLR